VGPTVNKNFQTIIAVENNTTSPRKMDKKTCLLKESYGMRAARGEKMTIVRESCLSNSLSMLNFQPCETVITIPIVRINFKQNNNLYVSARGQSMNKEKRSMNKD